MCKKSVNWRNLQIWFHFTELAKPTKAGQLCATNVCCMICPAGLTTSLFCFRNYLHNYIFSPGTTGTASLGIGQM